MEPEQWRELEDYMELELFGVPIDESEELSALVEKARGRRDLDFPEKLQAIKSLTIGSMQNAYEGMFTHPDSVRRQQLKEIVFFGHPLSYVLSEKAGCCRYQGALFFILGYESGLGDRHFLQSAKVNRRVHTVFNDVYDADILHRVSIFTESLENPGYDYSRQNPLMYEQIDTYWPGINFYSYHRKDGRLVIVEGMAAHKTSI